MDNARERQRGIAAQQLLENEMWQEAFNSIDAKLCDQLGFADLEPERVAKLQALLAAHRTLRRYWVSVIQTGTMAAMDEETRRRRSLRDIFKVA